MITMESIVTKTITLVMVLLLVGVGVVPVIDAMNTYETTETETVTYGTNTGGNFGGTPDRGDFDGTTFTMSPTGDWYELPVFFLTNPNVQYKVKAYDVYYAPDANGQQIGLYVPDTTGVKSSLNLTLTQDPNNTDLYIMTADTSSDNMDNVYIKVNATNEYFQNVYVDMIYNAPYINNLDDRFYITQDGDLYAKGSNAYGQMGNGTATDLTNWTKIAEDAVYVASSGKSTFYIDDSGDLYAAGYNSAGELGTGDTTTTATWTKVGQNAVKVMSSYNMNGGWEGTLYLDTNGDLYGSGRGELIGLGFNKTTFTLAAQNVADFEVRSGCAYYLNTSGDLYFSGINTYGAGGTGSLTTVNTWTLTASSVSKFSVALGGAMYSPYAAYYIDTNGDLYSTGYNAAGWLGTGNTSDVDTWTKTASNAVAVTANLMTNDRGTAFYIGTDGNLYTAGSNNNFQNGLESTSNATSWTQTTTNVTVTSILQMDTLYCSAWKSTGELSTAGIQMATGQPSTTGWYSYFYGENPSMVFGMAYDTSYCLYFLTNTEYPTWEAVGETVTEVLYTNPDTGYFVYATQGTVSEGTFTASADGDYWMLPNALMEWWTDYEAVQKKIGSGQTFYVADGTTITETGTAPTVTGITDATLTMTALVDNDQVFDVTGYTAGTDYSLIIPVTITYEETTTVTHERIPLLNIVPLVLIVMAIVYVVSALIVDRRGY